MIATLCRPKVRRGGQNPAYRGVDCLRIDKEMVMALAGRLRCSYFRSVLRQYAIGLKTRRA